VLSDPRKKQNYKYIVTVKLCYKDLPLDQQKDVFIDKYFRA